MAQRFVPPPITAVPQAFEPEQPELLHSFLPQAGEPISLHNGAGESAANLDALAELPPGSAEPTDLLTLYLREIRRNTLFTPEQELETATRARAGDESYGFAFNRPRPGVCSRPVAVAELPLCGHRRGNGAPGQRTALR